MNLRRYVGRPWSEKFTCWDLVRTVQREEFGRELPELAIGEDYVATQEAAMLQLAGPRGTWARVAVPAVGDILVCRSVSGPHVGVVAPYNRVLHNVGSRSNPGAVRVDRISDLAYAGFQRVTYWRPRHD